MRRPSVPLGRECYHLRRESNAERVVPATPERTSGWMRVQRAIALHGHARGRRAPGGRREVVWCGLRARCPRRQSPNHTCPPVRGKHEAQSSSTRGTTGSAHFMTRVRIDVRHATVCERCVRGRRRAVRLPAAPWRVASEGTAHCCSLEHGQAGSWATSAYLWVLGPTEQCIFSLDSRDDQRACWGRPGRRRASFRRATPRNTGLT